MAEKYLYFRGDATLASDDDAADGSNVYPLSSFKGMEAVSDTTFTLFFTQKHNSFTGGHDDATYGINDQVTLTCGTNLQKASMKALAEAFATAKSSFLVVADDVNGEYLVNGVTAVSDFTVQADNA